MPQIRQKYPIFPKIYCGLLTIKHERVKDLPSIGQCLKNSLVYNNDSIYFLLLLLLLLLLFCA